MNEMAGLKFSYPHLSAESFIVEIRHKPRKKRKFLLFPLGFRIKLLKTSCCLTGRLLGWPLGMMALQLSLEYI